ncbi:MAG: hypothetical protein AMJ94_09210 [Deltaproteobacteria bacterium SM23_61]|nr:MAG: hypothetical protein AMJ94_09210 [Deltaproteobacteria bacterium SM23_61]
MIPCVLNHKFCWSGVVLGILQGKETLKERAFSDDKFPGIQRFPRFSSAKIFQRAQIVSSLFIDGWGGRYYNEM